MYFHIDASSGIPIYRQLVGQITQAITGGLLRPGDRLPSVRELARELTINPNTVARAYLELERDGLIEAARGSGTYVTATIPALSREERLHKGRELVRAFVSEVRRLGLEPRELLGLIKHELGGEEG